jgi:hypothetical protein
LAANLDEDDELRAADVPDENLRDAIVRLEDRIEELSQSIESCRKVMLASRIAIAAGAALLLVLVIGAIGFDPLAMVAGFAAVIGGIVLLGSNSSTAQQASAAVRATEAQRAALIGRIELRVVSGQSGGPANGNPGWPARDASRSPTIH